EPCWTFISGKRTLHVRVPEERRGHLYAGEYGVRVLLIHQILILVARGTVHQLNSGFSFHWQRALRERLQPGKIFRRQVFPRPSDGRGCDGIEITGVADSAGSLVVVSAHKDISEAPADFHHFIRVRTVTNDIAKIDR